MSFAPGRIVLDLADGRRVMTPLEFYPTLFKATPSQRARWEYLGSATGLEWPEFDLQLSVASIVAGRREHVPPRGWREGLSSRLGEYRKARGLR